MKKSLGALAAAATLVVPAAAAAHPSVYESKGYTGADRKEQTRYVVSNHGFTTVLRETNGLTDARGVVGYNLIPGDWRAGKDFATIMATGGTGAQAHATCLTPKLETEEAIRSWQEGDPFYNYVPFQATSAGLEDDPATWLPTLQANGYDITKLGRAECEKDAGATYVPADETQTSIASMASGSTKPLEDKLAAVTAENTTLAGELTTVKSQLAAAQAAATPLKVSVASAKARTVARRGAKVTVTAQPAKRVKVTVSVSEGLARTLKLRSTVLGTKTVTTAADGTATATVKLRKAAAKAVRALKKSVSVTIQATSDDRFATAKHKFTR